MPPKKAEKVPRRARARAQGRRKPHPAAGLKIIGASFVVLALGVAWLNAVSRSETDDTVMPYNQGGVTTVAGGDGGGILPSTRAAVPVPFGPNTLVTIDEGLVTTTTTAEGEVTTTSLLAAASHPATTWVERWLSGASATTSTTGGRGPATTRPGHPGTTATTRPGTTTTTTRPTTTTSTSTTSTTQPTTTSSTTTTTAPTTSTTQGPTTTEGDGSTTTSP
jgi:hypothetical protein